MLFENVNADVSNIHAGPHVTYLHMLDDNLFSAAMLKIMTDLRLSAFNKFGVIRTVVYINAHNLMDTVIFFVDTEKLLRINRTAASEGGTFRSHKAYMEQVACYDAANNRIKQFMAENFAAQVPLVIQDGRFRLFGMYFIENFC